MFQIIILLLWLTTAESVAEYPLAKPGCQERCGNIDIPYPFGIGPNCSIADGFAVICNHSSNPPKPFIKIINLEVLQISLSESTVQVNNPVITSNCPGRANGKDVYFFSTPFTFSDTHNRFTAMGCNNLALLVRGSNIITACMSICNAFLPPSLNETAGCYGINCCQTRIPHGLRMVNASLKSIDPNNNQHGCKYAFMVDYQWFSDKDIFNVSEMDYVPAVLDWGCDANGSFCSANAHCSLYNANTSWNGRYCFCDEGYEGNPYLPSGCQDIDECSDPNLNHCGGFCLNAPGGYNCSCPDGLPFSNATIKTFVGAFTHNLLVRTGLLFRLTWDLRLRIATEIAGALFYLHSLASIPIYHRDIKSTNILLDEKFRAKVSDFGISRSISVDNTHLTTAVQGTFGYLDPEYFQSSQFTEKSDVYSFGVVLVELLTGKKPILSGKSNEGGSLTAYFLLIMKENRLYDILDARVVKEGGEKEILRVANIAKRCLYLHGSSRPTMKEVVMELDGIRMSNGATATVKQSCDNVEYATEDDLTEPQEAVSTSTGSSYCAMDIELPLLLDKSSSSL
ncbi:wall-associated receptor kinase-like 8 [Rhododendron vialii]|uniref:wall-associated receptor kinase-like 8 n=1 Tax=Rhododendron vialii TaxID=182163 RepID=UPI0026605154|nr:wall-associated receptor kinase-like 8 [Rhododendron vialii]